MKRADVPTQEQLVVLIALGVGAEDISGYNDLAQARKDTFHRFGAIVLRALADAMHLPPSSYTVRSNKGGIAVGGEVTLHSDEFYVQLGVPSQLGVMHRRCKNRDDCTGGPNQWTPWVSLLSLDTLAERIKKAPAVVPHVLVTPASLPKRRRKA